MATTVAVECKICLDNVTKYVTCVFCNDSFCLPDSKRYILEYVNSKCPSCAKPWTRVHLRQMFGKPFMATEYKKKRERDVLETERALLPQTQDIMNAAKQSEVNEILLEVSRVSNQLQRIVNRLSNIDYLESDVGKVVLACQISILTLDLKIVDQKTDESKATQVFKCSTVRNGESCRGFVVLTGNKYCCGLCRIELCIKCREQKNDDHKCNPDTVSTIALLKADSKPCPKCGVFIYKIAGCNQMFCTACNTAFTWNRLEIIKSRIHNPHYFDYLRRLGHTPMQDMTTNCGALEDVTRYPEYMWAFYRLIMHYEDVEQRKIQTLIDHDNYKLREQYLLGKIDESTFAIKVQRHYKKAEYAREIYDIVQTFISVGSDILKNSKTNKKQPSNNEKANMIKQISTLMDYIDVELENMSSVFDYRKYRFGYSFLHYKRDNPDN